MRTMVKDDIVTKCIRGTSDYGLYGGTGTFATDTLPVSRCCLLGPIVACKYDDTPGWRETSYVIKCDRCDWATVETSEIEQTIKAWNKLVT